jgi:hypothetical protein
MSEPVLFPEIPLTPAPRDADARSVIGFKRTAPEIGSRHKLGGTPDWLQGPDVPSCDHCRGPMTFYGQLDSVGDRMCLADCGIVYVFVCIDCFSSKSLIQSG